LSPYAKRHHSGRFTQADLALIPVHPSPLDMLAYSELVPLLRQAQAGNKTLKIQFVINQLSPNTILGRDVVESLAEAEIPLLPTALHYRQIYAQVVAKGRSVITTSGPARDEIFGLARDVSAQLAVRVVKRKAVPREAATGHTMSERP